MILWPLEVCFWVGVCLVAYTYFIYPLILVTLSGLRNFISEEREKRAESNGIPNVTVLFAAYNEEAVIQQKMLNCATLDYPRDRLEILIGCDGCSDRTVELAEAAGLAHARVFDYRPRSGKPMVLNKLVPEAKGDVLVFSDANTMISPGSIRALVKHFADPRVGCVSGELVLTAPKNGPKSEGLYWRYEVFLKFLESRMDMLLGANGAVFALRRGLFKPLSPDAIIDDFLIAMNARMQGYRILYDREAWAEEETAQSVGQEFQRRIRIGAGNYHALRYTWSLLLPWAGPVCFSYWSHKVYRWLVPFALPLIWVSSVLLAWQGSLFYGVAAGLGAIFALLAWIGSLHERRGKKPRTIFAVPYYFLSMNLALLFGFFRFVSRTQGVIWKRTDR